MINANFTVNGAANPAEQLAAYGATVTLALTALSGISTITWTIDGTSANDTAPTITPAGSPSGATATFAMPADSGDGLGRAYMVHCHVTNARESADQYAIVGAVNSANILPIVAGEQNYRNATMGWTLAVNRMLASATVGGASQTIAGSGTWNGSSRVVLVTTSGARTVTLGSAPIGMRVLVVDSAGNTSTAANQITVANAFGIYGYPAILQVDNASAEFVSLGAGLGWVAAAASPAAPLNAVISPAALAGNTDNWSPTGIALASTIRISSTGAINLTGIQATGIGPFSVGGPFVQQKLIVNVNAANAITLKEQVTSTAANQFMNSTAADIVLAAKQAADMTYDVVSARWRVFKRN